MNIVEMWKKGKSRIEQGVIYSDGIYFPVFQSANSEYEAASAESIASSILEKPDWWFYYSISSKYRLSENIVVAGSGPYEGEGFVALLGANESLVWVLHFDDCEALEIETCSESEIIVFGSNGYKKNIFHVPCSKPEKFTFKQEYM